MAATTSPAAPQTKSFNTPSSIDKPNGSAHRTDSTDSEVEDYDAQKVDRSALVGGKHKSQDFSAVEDADGEFEVQVVDTKSARELVPKLQRRQSIPITIEKTDKRGRFLLTADDPEIREVLRRGLERLAPSSTNKRSSKLRDLVFTRRFTTFDRQNPSESKSTFHGFFTLFWLGMAILLLRVAAYNWKIYGSVLGNNEIMRIMFAKDVIVLGLTDGVMCASTVVGLVLQLLICRGWISWNRSGWIIQNLWQTFYLGACVGWTFYREWPWTHTIFIVLHAMVFIMKQHSYAFYNGYLSQVYVRRNALLTKRDQLDKMSPVSSPVSSPISSPQNSPLLPNTPDSTLRHRGSGGTSSTPKSAHPAASKPPSGNLSRESNEIAAVAHAISTAQPLTPDQLHLFRSILSSEIDMLTTELQGKASDPANAYPHNLTLSNFGLWTIFPTLVYELEYPRQERTDWWYVAEKTAATFGGIFIMVVISQAYIYPQVKETVRMKEQGMPIAARSEHLPWIILDMLFPLLLEQLLTWYVIWECILNVLAEVTRFADRGFYGDWWNSTSWDQYARDWNRPVHNFLLRHVYHSSISAFHLSKSTATFATFFLSACVHELLMFCLFKKVRGYLFGMQLMQLPLVALSRTRVLREWQVLGNVIFWIGLFVGPSVLTSMYLIV